jgi:hypothetical protein
MTDTAENFVDFKNVWLAYNEALLAQNQFAVEDITCRSRKASSSPSSAPQVAANRHS